MAALTGRRKLVLAVVLLSVLILIPFVIWEERMNAFAASLMSSDHSRPTIAAAVAMLLAADVALPVPSSIVSTTGSYLLGFTLGLTASWTGMTMGCVIGYGLGRYAGRSVVLRFVSPNEMEQSAADLSAKGDWLIVASRAVPMLAEASVIMAGVLCRPFPRFFLVCSLANLGISLVYAVVGAFSLHADSFLLAYAGAIVVPLIGMRITRRRTDIK